MYELKTLLYSLGKQGVRVQFEGSDGEKYTIKLEGTLSKDKVMRLMDMYELLSRKETEKIPDPEENTVFAKIQSLVRNRFTFKQFTSDQIQEAFEDNFNRPMKLAEASTYLSRMTENRILTRTKRGRKWLYSLVLPGEVEIPRTNLLPKSELRRIIER
jgi:hypothetical protein